MGLVQSVDGLRRIRLRSTKEEGILIWVWHQPFHEPPACQPSPSDFELSRLHNVVCKLLSIKHYFFLSYLLCFSRDPLTSTVYLLDLGTWMKQFGIFFFFLRPHLQHMEVPRLGVESELQLPAYITAKAILDPSCICNIHHSLQQCRILNPLSKAKDQTCTLTDTMLGS